MNLLQYTFFQHALLGSLLASIACGIIGTYIVTRRLVFISGGITHASFGGIGLGLFAGISPILSAAVFSVLSAFGVEWLSRRKDMREDSAIAVFWTLGMALGIMFSFLSPGFAPDLSAYLFGNILTINQTDLWMLGILALLLTGFFYLFIRPIVYIAFDREFARSQKIPVEIFEYLLMMFIALTIVACLRMVGIVLGTGKYALNLKALQYQKHSADGLSQRISELRKSKGNKVTWEDMKTFLGEEMGFWKQFPLSWEQEKTLRDEFEKSFVKNKVVFAESMYSKSEPMAARAKEVMDEIAMIGWVSGGHSAGYVPVFAIGAGSQLFGEKIDNTEIPKRIAKAAGYK